MTLVLTLFLALALALPPPELPPRLPGTFVRFADLASCPRLPPRADPSRADDVRPDDIRVLMALGDSISAGLLATNREEDTSQLVLSPSLVEEYRGRAYPIGGDPGAVTLPNILSHYANVTGAATGHRPPVTCAIPGLSELCIPHDEEDGLSAAVSGSTAAALVGQVREYLLPTYLALSEEKRRGWAFVNVGIGANDICAFCLAATTPAGPGSPEEFARGIRDAVQLLRNRVPKLIVNIMGVLRVSAVYDLTRDDPYCSRGLPLPHLPLECGCALLPGLVGDYTRRKMDDLAEAYDTAVLRVIRAWAAEEDETFAAIWQPASALDLPNYPLEAVSPLDCFHPSGAAHARLAAGVWNRLSMDMARKALPIEWEDDIWVRCLEEDDRILTHEV